MRLLPIRTLLSRCLAVLLTVAGMTLGSALQATEVGDLYQAEAPAAGRTAAHQKQAMADALRQVAMKVSGRFDLRDEQINGLLKRADTLVQSYAFVGGGRREPLRLQVSFDAAAVNAGLQQSGLPVWGSNRPKVLLWLVVEDGGKRRIASQELDAPLLQQVKAQSRQQGLPFDLPINDVTDMQAISAADVWAGFLENVRQASERYHPDITVLAKVYKAGLLWQGDWQIVAVGGTHTQDFTGPDMASVVEPGIGWVIQDIASVYAKTTGAAVAGAPLMFRISGVDSLKDYAAVQAYLKRLVVVKNIAVQEVGAGTLSLAITSDTQVDTILQTLKADGRLREVVQPVAATPTPAAPDQAGTASATPTPAAGNAAVPAAPSASPGHVLEFEWHG